MLLYIHVPFCASKCHYCAFYSEVLSSGDSAPSQYLQTLLQEITWWSKKNLPSPIETIFLGGGTPSLMPAKAIALVLDTIAQHFNLEPNPEISIEANPDSALARDWLKDAKNAGLNRISFGVQSLDDTTLKLLGRRHTARQALEAFQAARSAGFKTINLDMMWGLPGTKHPQRQRHWLRDLNIITSMEPEHLSLYGLSVEPGSHLQKLQIQNTLRFPSEAEQSALYLHGAEFLESKGLLQYEIANFARLGYHCVHNTYYWEGHDYLGFGPGATSTLNNKRWTNPPNIHKWQQVVQKNIDGEINTAQEETLGPLEQTKELLMLHLRMQKGLALSLWEDKTGQSFQSDFRSLINALIKSNLAIIRNGHFRLTRPGMLVSNTILEHFFNQLEK